MGRRRSPGLVKRGNIWHIDKAIRGHGRLCKSTQSDSLEIAEQVLEDAIRGIREASSSRPAITWRKVAMKYLEDNQDKASIIDDSYHLEDLDPFIGHLLLFQVHDETLKPFVEAQRAKGLKTKTINMALGIVRMLLNTCANSWRNKVSGLTWLETAPKITMQKPPQGRSDSKVAYPLDWKEQDKLFQILPDHLARMSLFKVNSGCREAEVCGLKWEWEWITDIPSLKGRIFIVPGDIELTPGSGVKNREDRLVVLNDIAKSVLDSLRGGESEYVFTYRGNPLAKMNNTAWQNAWKKAGLPDGDKFLKGVHNLKHTFGRRLRGAGVSIETRKVLLGHTNGDITTHYSEPEVQELLVAVNSVCQRSYRKTPALTVVQLKAVIG